MYMPHCPCPVQAVALPAGQLPQFQMYRWAFVREGEPSSQLSSPVPANNNGPVQQDFVPHIARISSLMEQRVSSD